MDIPGVSFQSRLLGVTHPTSSSVFRLLSLFSAGLLPFCAGVPAIGVGHPACWAVVHRSDPPAPLRIASFAAPSGVLTPLSASELRHVGHPVSVTASQMVCPSWCLLFGFDRAEVRFRPFRASLTVAVCQPV
jgi:hypothetical protein